MDSINPRWDPGFLTGIYYHKKFSKVCLSESPVDCSSENSLASVHSEEQKRLVKVYQTDMKSGDNKMIAVYNIDPEIAQTYSRLEVRLSINRLNLNF